MGLDIVEVALKLEEEFAVSFADDEMFVFCGTLGNVHDLLLENCTGAQKSGLSNTVGILSPPWGDGLGVGGRASVAATYYRNTDPYSAAGNDNASGLVCSEN